MSGKPVFREKTKKSRKQKKSVFKGNNYTQQLGRTIARFPGSGFPDSLHMKMKYVSNVAVSTSSVDQKYSGSGVYDPDISGTGSQPRYFDELVQIYGRYRVKASSLTLEYINRGTEPFGVCIYPSPDITTITYLNALEQRDGIPSQVVFANQGFGLKMSSYATTKSIIEFPGDDSLLWGTVSTNPTQQWYYHVCAQNLTAIPSSNIGTIMVKINYYIEWFDKFQATPS